MTARTDVSFVLSMYYRYGLGLLCLLGSVFGWRGRKYHSGVGSSCLICTIVEIGSI